MEGLVNRVLLGVIGAGVIVAAAPSQAATARFSIPGGDLRRALDAFVVQSGVQLIYREQDVAALRTPGVSGSLDVSAALSQLLSGTGLAAERDSSGAIAITRPRAVATRDTRRAVPPRAQQDPTPDAPVEMADGDGFTDIVVTARRQDERLQSTPVSISAFTADDLYRSSITRASDLQTVTPGLQVASAGSQSNPTLTLRGQRRTTIGEGAPTVVIYENEVPLPVLASLIPTFDMSSVQVLKGPQGTLFGRNATAGAVLLYSTEPKYRFEGYLGARFGNYSRRELEGAINIPIVEDKVALRVAGQIARRAGYTKNLGLGPDLDNRRDESGRISLLLTPVDGIKNVTVFERFHSNDRGGSELLYGTYPNPSGGSGAARAPGNAARFNCNTDLACDIDLQLARQQAIGPRRTYVDIAPYSRITLDSMSNTTTLSLSDDIRLKNIFGYRTVKYDFLLDLDGTPLPILAATRVVRSKQLTDELQLSGKLLSDKLSWIVGGFYLTDRPNGLIYDRVGVYTAPGAALINAYAYRRTTSKAVYGQVSYDLSAIVSGLKVDLGARRTWDRSVVCSAGVAASQPLIGEKDCSSRGQTIGGKFAATTWTAGVNWQVSQNLFAYVTSRRGYRGGGINTPFLAPALASVQSYAPETITDVEAGIKASGRLAGAPFQISADAYRGWYKGIQRNYTPAPNFDGDNNPANDPTSGVIVNAGKAILQGVEFEARIKPVTGLSLSVSGAYTDAHYQSLTLPPVLVVANLIPANAVDNKFPFVPAWTYGAQAEYTKPLGRAGTLLLRTDVYHSDDFWLNDRPANDSAAFVRGYEVVNARLGLLDIAGSGLDLSVFVNNLFDNDYVSGTGNFAPGLSFVSVAYGAPRFYGVEARYKF